jgi:hypothetical protein
MGQVLRRASLLTRMAIALTIVALTFGAVGATSATSQKSECNWGVSSVSAWVDANGTVHQTEPVATGCIPRGN